MLQKSLRGLTPTTFWLTPEALTATLLLKMNRGVLDVAHMSSKVMLPCKRNSAHSAHISSGRPRKIQKVHEEVRKKRGEAKDVQIKTQPRKNATKKDENERIKNERC